jgi:hypothetical protein
MTAQFGVQTQVCIPAFRQLETNKPLLYRRVGRATALSLHEHPVEMVGRKERVDIGVQTLVCKGLLWLLGTNPGLYSGLYASRNK